MILSDPSGNPQAINSKIKAVNGKEMSAEAVFVAAFEYIKTIVIENLQSELKKSKIAVEINGMKDIQWIVTVPAIWDDMAKNKMITWIGKAGLIDKNIKDHCILKYEPDCASLSLQHELAHKMKKNGNNLFDDDIKNESSKGNDDHNPLNGKKYILIDAGGGTVDIACHQFMNNNSVKELYYPSGGPWGDMYVDDAFENILNDLLGNDLLNSIKKDEPNAYFNLFQNFRKTKMHFEDKGDGKFINIRFPGDFVNAIENDIEWDELESKLENFEYKGHKNCFGIDDDYLRIDCLIWKKYLYDPLIHKVIDHVKMLLTKDIMKDCSYIYLVGGYSKTPYFRSNIMKSFGLNSQYNIDVISPERPLLSVVDGASRMGLLKNNKREYVQVRILSKTYGAAVAKQYRLINLNEYPKDYINDARNSYISKRNGQKYLGGCFLVYAKKGDAITVDHKIVRRTKRRSKNDILVTKAFYSSTKNDPKLISDGTKLAECIIEWPKNDSSYASTTEMVFGGEMIKAISYPTNMPKLRKDVQFKYDWM